MVAGVRGTCTSRPSQRAEQVQHVALFPSSALNPGVRKREVFGWVMYDFANSGYTTVVILSLIHI